MWEILEILDQEETLGPRDRLVTKEEQDSTTQDHEDQLEKEVNQAGEDPEEAEVNVGPKEILGIKERQESLGDRDSQGSQDGEDPEENLDLMGIRDLWAMLASLTVMS